MEDRRECSDRKIVSRCRERARRVYYGAVFEVKKEILAYIGGVMCQSIIDHSLENFGTKFGSHAQ
jgi:hypothetical protein